MDGHTTDCTEYELSCVKAKLESVYKIEDVKELLDDGWELHIGGDKATYTCDLLCPRDSIGI